MHVQLDAEQPRGWFETERDAQAGYPAELLGGNANKFVRRYIDSKTGGLKPEYAVQAEQDAKLERKLEAARKKKRF